MSTANGCSEKKESKPTANDDEGQPFPMELNGLTDTYPGETMETAVRPLNTVSNTMVNGLNGDLCSTSNGESDGLEWTCHRPEGQVASWVEKFSDGEQLTPSASFGCMSAVGSGGAGASETGSKVSREDIQKALEVAEQCRQEANLDPSGRVLPELIRALQGIFIPAGLLESINQYGSNDERRCVNVCSSCNSLVVHISDSVSAATQTDLSMSDMVDSADYRAYHLNGPVGFHPDNSLSQSAQYETGFANAGRISSASSQDWLVFMIEQRLGPNFSYPSYSEKRFSVRQRPPVAGQVQLELDHSRLQENVAYLMSVWPASACSGNAGRQCPSWSSRAAVAGGSESILYATACLLTHLKIDLCYWFFNRPVCLGEMGVLLSADEKQGRVNMIEMTASPIADSASLEKFFASFSRRQAVPTFYSTSDLLAIVRASQNGANGGSVVDVLAERFRDGQPIIFSVNLQKFRIEDSLEVHFDNYPWTSSESRQKCLDSLFELRLTSWSWCLAVLRKLSADVMVLSVGPHSFSLPIPLIGWLLDLPSITVADIWDLFHEQDQRLTADTASQLYNDLFAFDAPTTANRFSLNLTGQLAHFLRDLAALSIARPSSRFPPQKALLLPTRCKSGVFFFDFAAES